MQKVCSSLQDLRIHILFFSRFFNMMNLCFCVKVSQSESGDMGLTLQHGGSFHCSLFHCLSVFNARPVLVGQIKACLSYDRPWSKIDKQKFQTLH